MAYKTKFLVPESTRLKQREIRLRLWQNPEYRKRMSDAQKGKVFSEETRKKIALAQTGSKNNLWIGGVTVGENWKLYKKEYNKKWILKNRLKYRLWNHKRRALIRKIGRLKYETAKMVYDENLKKYGVLTCYLCLESIEENKDTIDHKNPLFRGGTNDFENLGIAHSSCNKRKHIKTEEEYRNWVISNEGL